jgi:hypothetical protein
MKAGVTVIRMDQTKAAKGISGNKLEGIRKVGRPISYDWKT